MYEKLFILTYTLHIQIGIIILCNLARMEMKFIILENNERTPSFITELNEKIQKDKGRVVHFIETGSETERC